jgi:hypothetical protein
MQQKAKIVREIFLHFSRIRNKFHGRATDCSMCVCHHHHHMQSHIRP